MTLPTSAFSRVSIVSNTCPADLVWLAVCVWVSFLETYPYSCLFFILCNVLVLLFRFFYLVGRLKGVVQVDGGRIVCGSVFIVFFECGVSLFGCLLPMFVFYLGSNDLRSRYQGIGLWGLCNIQCLLVHRSRACTPSSASGLYSEDHSLSLLGTFV